MQLDLRKNRNREIGTGDLISACDIKYLVIYDNAIGEHRLLNTETMKIVLSAFSLSNLNNSNDDFQLIAKESELRITDDMGGK